LLSELLAQRGDRVIGVSRGQTRGRPGESWEPVDLLDPGQVLALIEKTRPAECYYLPAFHHSAEDAGLRTGDPSLFERSHAVHVRGLLHFLHAIARVSPPTRLFYAASSHVFGAPAVQPQDESTPLNPENVYGITKTMGIHCCRHFRRELGVFVRGVLAFQNDPAQKLVLGDLNAVVDWGYAGDYAAAMTRILAHPEPEDFVVATGEPRTVLEFLQTACELAGVDWRECAVTNPGLLRKKPTLLVGNSARLRKLTGWEPRVSFRQMIELMMTAARAGAAVLSSKP